MEGGDGEQGAVDVNAYFVTDGAKPPAPKSLADCGAVPPKCSGFGPWVWLSALWGLYAGWLKRSPLLTKAITSGVLALGGDTAAQCFEYHEQGGTGPFFKDTRRLLAVGVDSVFVTGPALHTLYEFLERLVPTNTGGFLPAAFHVLVDTFVFDPIFVASFFCTTGLLESRSLKEDILPALRSIIAKQQRDQAVIEADNAVRRQTAKRRDVRSVAVEGTKPQGSTADGHDSREKAAGVKAERNRRYDNKECFLCGKQGHKQRDYPQSQQGKAGKGVHG
eukprot:jgi/Undpi1/2684/HiC_scaffold_13.g06062.m1